MRNPEFWAAKGPDFIGRLRWHVDSLALIVHLTKGWGFSGSAVLLFSRKYFKGRKDGFPVMAPFDKKLQRAFFEVTGFRHGVRSMEAIVEMSRWGGGEQPIRLTDLPPKAERTSGYACGCTRISGVGKSGLTLGSRTCQTMCTKLCITCY